MQRYRLDYFFLFTQACQVVQRDCHYKDALKSELADFQISGLERMVEGLAITMEHAEADKSLLAQIRAFAKLLGEGKEKRPAVIGARLDQIMLGMDMVLRNRLFMFIPQMHAPSFMNLEQFGGAVKLFPGAVSDMLEAGNCYAADRPTACVFHCMRVAEFGLRHIAEELGVELTDGKKPCPIDFATWEKVLVGIENKRGELRKTPKSEEHNKKTREYASLADICSYLKDIWRNDTMHSRRHYPKEEALLAMSRVAQLMNLIAGSEYAPPVDPAWDKAVDALKEISKSFRVEEQSDPAMQKLL